MNAIKTSWLGLLEYQKSLDFQYEQAEKIHAQEMPEVILGLEHPTVITLGKRGGLVHSIDIPIIKTNRGGLATGHEPGQLVIYPLIHIQKRQIHIREWVSLLEESCITFFRNHGLVAHRGVHSGLWVDNKKIASIGLQIKKGVSMHGISINIHNTLSIFSHMEVCGLSALRLTSLHKEDVQMQLENAFTEIAYIVIERLQQKEA